jgi:hypothetical protein
VAVAGKAAISGPQPQQQQQQQCDVGDQPAAACAMQQAGPWVCHSVGDDGSSKCNGWGMTAEDRRCRKCGAPRPFLAHELQVGQAIHFRGCGRGGSGHPRSKGSRWGTGTASGECHLSIHDATSVRGRQAAARLRERFGLGEDDSDSYIHVEWQEPAAETAAKAEAADTEPDGASDVVATPLEFLLCASSITAQAVLMRKPELLTDGAGKVELLLELDSTPRASDETIAAQLAEHHHPMCGHGLLSVVVCFEALAAFAPVLKLDSLHHAPNHRKLEQWLVHLPPAVYTHHTREFIMWSLHTLIPFVTVLWGLWQLYFNIDLFHQLINDSLRMAADAIERVVGPVLSVVWLALEAAEAWLIWFTEQFNLWLRPVKIVIQPVITAGVTVIRPVITTGVTVVTMLWKFGSFIGQQLFVPVRAVVQYLEPVWSTVRTAVTKLFSPIVWLAQTAYGFASAVGTRVKAVVLGFQNIVQSFVQSQIMQSFGTKLGKIWDVVHKKLPGIMTIKPQKETKILVQQINKIAKTAQPMAKAAVQKTKSAASAAAEAAAAAAATGVGDGTAPEGCPPVQSLEREREAFDALPKGYPELSGLVHLSGRRVFT